MSRLVWNSHKSPTVDSFISKLVNTWTSCLLLVFSLVITLKLAWGDSFRCTASYDVSESFVDSNCYAEYVYTSSPYRPSISSDTDRKYHSYYPCVNLLFLLQAFLFYVPLLLWKTYESGCVRRLTSGLEISATKEQKKALEVQCLAKFVLLTHGKHNMYTSVHIFFELCNFVVSLSMTVWLRTFFNVADIPAIQYIDVSTWETFRNFYFPPTGSCELTAFSASGVKMKIGAICLLPLNRLYMNMYLFLRAWYIILIFLTILVLVYRLILVLPKCRSVVLRVLSPLSPSSTLSKLCSWMSYSDSFFLTTTRTYLTDLDFSKLVEKIVVLTHDHEREEDERSSVYEESQKDLDSTATTPV